MMKFLVSKNIHSNPNFTLLLGFYALMMLLYFIGDIFYLLDFFGASVKEVLDTLKGDENTFTEPLSLLTLLEHIHISLFLAIMALFTTMAILLRIRLSHGHKKALIALSMTSLLISYICLVSTYYWHDAFVYGFVLSELLWHLVGIYTLSIVLYQLGRKQNDL